MRPLSVERLVVEGRGAVTASVLDVAGEVWRSISFTPGDGGVDRERGGIFAPPFKVDLGVDDDGRWELTIVQMF